MKFNEKQLFEGYENTRLVSYGEIDENFENAVYYDELGEKGAKGLLKASLYRNGRLLQVYSGQDSHAGIVAATRLGKTTSFVIPTIFSNAMQKEKKSMIISDPKGELYQTASEFLRGQGYNVKLINLRDWKHSETWNPLTPIYRKYIEAYNVASTVEVIQTENGPRNVFQGKVYEDQAELDRDISRYQSLLMTNVDNEIESIALMIMPTMNVKDPYWDDSARCLLKAFLWGMLEDTHPDREGVPAITEDTYSFSTIIDLKNSMYDDGRDYKDGGYFSRRDKKSTAYKLAKNIVLENAPVTRRCIVSDFDAKLGIFKDNVVRLITSCNSFEMSDIADGERPIAIFIGYKDELRVHYEIISLFIQCAYAYLIDYTRTRESGALNRPLYFILDEFGSFPKIKDFDTTIAACGGRNIWFILILQSYAQLNTVYGEGTANIILDNLNLRMFMGSNNQQTLNKFSEECGRMTRIAPSSALNGKGGEIENFNVEVIPLMPVSRLSYFAAGECIIKEANRGYVMFSRLERYFNCKEFNSLPRASENNYKCAVNPLDERYTYDFTVESDEDSDSFY